MNRRRMTLIIAAVLAFGTGLLFFNYLMSVNKSTSAMPTRTVLVALKDIPASTSITPDMLRLVSKPGDSVEPDALSSAASTTGTIAMIGIPAGSAITASKIARPADMALPVRLNRGMRAISIAVDRVKGVSGLLNPGDHVDVIAVVSRLSNEEPHAYTILRSVPVLAVGSSLETARATPAPDPGAGNTTVTLEVTPSQADLLSVADLNATLRLTLLSPHDSGRAVPVEALHFPVNEFHEVRVAAPPMPQLVSAPQPTSRPAPPRENSGVPLLDGDRFVTAIDDRAVQ